MATMDALQFYSCECTCNANITCVQQVIVAWMYGVHISISCILQELMHGHAAMLVRL